KTLFHREPVVVYMGWDRPLQGFFMFIERPACGDDDCRYLYSNLDEEEPHPKTIGRYLDVLRCLEISIPDEMIDEVLRDGRENFGNKTIEHRIIDGRYRKFSV